MSRFYVVDTRVWEVVAPSEAEAIAAVLDDPDRAPVYHTTEAEPVVAPAAAAADRPALRVVR